MNIHLKVYSQDLYMAGIKEHPISILKKLGIKYSHLTPQSISDCIWFWNCVCDSIPDNFEELHIKDALECVGNGITKQEALEINRIYNS